MSFEFIGAESNLGAASFACPEAELLGCLEQTFSGG